MSEPLLTPTGRSTVARRIPGLPVLLAMVLGVVVDRGIAAAPWIYLATGWLAVIWLAMAWLAAHCRTRGLRTAQRSSAQRSTAECNSVQPISAWRPWALLLGLGAAAAGRHAITVRYVPVDSIEAFARPEGVSTRVRGVILQVEQLPSPQFSATTSRSRHSTDSRTGSSSRDSGGCHWEAQIDAIERGGQWQAAVGLIRGQGPVGLPRLVPGAEVQLYGELSIPPPPPNPGSPDWHARLRGISPVASLYVPHAACVHLLAAPRWWQAGVWLARLRVACHNRLLRYVAPEQQGLAAALLLGYVRGIPSDVNQSFMLTGLAHVLSISGLHIGMLVSAGMFLVRVRCLPYRFLHLLIVLCVGYALLTGSRAPVVRACILAQIACLGWLVKRPLHAWHMLTTAANALLLVRPAELFQLGTQLSFLAVAALIWHGEQASWIGPAHNRVHNRDQNPWHKLDQRFATPYQRWWQSFSEQIVRGLQASLTVWCVTTPLIMHHFGVVSLWSPLANLLLAMPLFLALTSGLLVMAGGGWVPGVGGLCGAVCSIALDLLCGISRAIEWLPGSHLWVLGPSRGVVALGLLGWLVVAKAAPRPLPGRVWLVLWSVWLAAGAAENIYHMERAKHRRDTRLYFFSIGNGHCALLRLPGGYDCLYDAGSAGTTRWHLREIHDSLRRLGIDRLHAVFLSQGGSDHINLLPGLAERVAIDQVLTCPGLFRPDIPELVALRQQLHDDSIPIRELKRGDGVVCGASRLEVLHPHGTFRPASQRSPTPLVLRVPLGAHHLLLPGDIDSLGLAYVLNQPSSRIDLMLAPHHGRGRAGLLLQNWCRARVVIVSAAAEAPESIMERAPTSHDRFTLQTGRDGCVTIVAHAAGTEIAIGTEVIGQRTKRNTILRVDNDHPP